MRATVHKPREFTGRHMLAITLGFFAVIIGANGIMAYLANSTWSGLVAANGYVASQSFNVDEAIAKAQEARGWKVEFRHDAGNLSLAFLDRNLTPINGMTVAGKLERPTTDREDKELAFTEEGRGTYRTEVSLNPGIWDAQVTASKDSAVVYRKSYRFVVK